jgi:hypothetical protein
MDFNGKRTSWVVWPPGTTGGAEKSSFNMLRTKIGQNCHGENQGVARQVETQADVTSYSKGSKGVQGQLRYSRHQR